MSNKRRSYSPQYKYETVMEAIRGDKSKAQICQERGITDGLLYRWEQEFETRAPGVFNNQQQSSSLEAQQQAQIAELERMVGRLTMELDVLKKSTSWLRSHRQSNDK